MAEEPEVIIKKRGKTSTGRVAAYIADELKADTFELIPAEPYSDADLDWTDRSSRVNKEHDDALPSGHRAGFHGSAGLE